MQRSILLALATLMAIPALANINGVVEMADGYTTLAIQDTQTNFGNNVNEMDAAFGLADESSFRLALTGNLGSGNAIVIYFDTQAGGQNTLNVTDGGIPSYVRGQSGMKFEAGFEADFAIALNRFNNDVFYNFVDLVGNSQVFAGSHAIDDGGALSFGQAFFDNSNTLGVDGGTGTSNGASATTGLELLINRAVLNYGNGGSKFMIMAMLTNNSDGFSSNQILGGIGGGNNLGFNGGGFGSSLIDFNAVGGTQSLMVNVVPEPATMLALGAGLAVFARRRRS